MVYRALARILGRGLDGRLAAGCSSSSGKLLATRAQQIVSLPHRQRLARDLENVLALCRRPPDSLFRRVSIRRAEVLASEDVIRTAVGQLRTPLPVAARGIALIGQLLTDGAGPLFCPVAVARCSEFKPLAEVLRIAVSALDPAAPLFETRHEAHDSSSGTDGLV